MQVGMNNLLYVVSIFLMQEGESMKFKEEVD